MRAMGYVRVSTEEQALMGVSLDAQEEEIRAYCDTRSYLPRRFICTGFLIYGQR